MYKTGVKKIIQLFYDDHRRVEYLGEVLRYRVCGNLRMSVKHCRSCTYQPVLYIDSNKLSDLRQGYKVFKLREVVVFFLHQSKSPIRICKFVQ